MIACRGENRVAEKPQTDEGTYPSGARITTPPLVLGIVVIGM